MFRTPVKEFTLPPVPSAPKPKRKVLTDEVEEISDFDSSFSLGDPVEPSPPKKPSRKLDRSPVRASRRLAGKEAKLTAKNGNLFPDTDEIDEPVKLSKKIIKAKGPVIEDWDTPYAPEAPENPLEAEAEVDHDSRPVFLPDSQLIDVLYSSDVE